MLQRWSPSKGERAETAGGQQTGGSSDGIRRNQRASAGAAERTGTAAVEEQRFEGQGHRGDETPHEPGDTERSVTQEGAEAAGTHRRRTSWRQLGNPRKRDEPQGRQQVATHLHTETGANPHGGEKPRRGNANPAGGHDNAASPLREEAAPSRRKQASACGIPGGLAKDRADAPASTARFGAIRSKLEREWTVSECESTGAILGFRSLRRGRLRQSHEGRTGAAGTPRCFGKPKTRTPLEGSQGHIGGMPQGTTIGHSRATGSGEGGPGNRTLRTSHPRGPGGESCQGRGGRRKEAIYLQLMRKAHISTEEGFGAIRHPRRQGSPPESQETGDATSSE